MFHLPGTVVWRNKGGPTGATGRTGATGATGIAGPTGPAGAVVSASMAIQVFLAGSGQWTAKHQNCKAIWVRMKAGGGGGAGSGLANGGGLGSNGQNTYFGPLTTFGGGAGGASQPKVCYPGVGGGFAGTGVVNGGDSYAWGVQGEYGGGDTNPSQQMLAGQGGMGGGGCPGGSANDSGSGIAFFPGGPDLSGANSNNGQNARPNTGHGGGGGAYGQNPIAWGLPGGGGGEGGYLEALIVSPAVGYLWGVGAGGAGGAAGAYGAFGGAGGSGFLYVMEYY